MGEFWDALSSLSKCSMRDVVHLPSTLSALDEPTVGGVVVLPFAPNPFFDAADAGVAAVLNFARRFVLAGVAINEARDGFFRLPGLTGLAVFFGAGVWMLFGVASAA